MMPLNRRQMAWRAAQDIDTGLLVNLGMGMPVHAADYLPSTPRFGIHYELLNRDRVERIRVKAMLEDPSPAGGVVGGPAPEEA